MGKIYDIVHQLHIISQPQANPVPIDAEAVKAALIKKIEQFDIDGVTVEDVEVDEYGIMVTFVDYENDQMDVYFVHDDNEGSMAVILGEEEDMDYLVVDLSPLAPTLLNHGNVDYINMTELSWLNKSALGAIFMAGDIGLDGDSDDEITQDDVELDTDDSQDDMIGVFRPVEGLTEEQQNELYASVVRGGKKVKLAIVKKIRRKRLSATKRMGIRRAARKRKQKASRISRKIKRSIKVRKRLGLKKQHLGKFRKIAGTSNRKR